MELLAANHRFHESLVGEMTRLEGLAQVEAVGVSTSLPLVVPPGGVVPVRVDGRPEPSNASALPRTSVHATSPGYFDVLRLRIRDGRAFTSLDGAGAPRVLVVNETLARQLFGGEPAVGRRLVLQGPGGSEPWQVVGIVADVVYEGLTLTQSRAEAFIPPGSGRWNSDVRVPPSNHHGSDGRRSACRRGFPRRGGERGVPVGDALRCDDNGCTAVDGHRPTPLLRGLRQLLRVPRRIPGRVRSLRPAQLHGRAATGRDRYPHGIGRAARRHSRSVAETGHEAGHGRRFHRRHWRRRVDPGFWRASCMALLRTTA